MGVAGVNGHQPMPCMGTNPCRERTPTVLLPCKEMQTQTACNKGPRPCVPAAVHQGGAEFALVQVHPPHVAVLIRGIHLQGIVACMDVSRKQGAQHRVHAMGGLS